MNANLYQSARRAGCSRAESELLAFYVELDSLKAAAVAAGVSYGSASNHMTRLKRRLQVRHLAAAVAKLERDYLTVSVN